MDKRILCLGRLGRYMNRCLRLGLFGVKKAVMVEAVMIESLIAANCVFDFVSEL